MRIEGILFDSGDTLVAPKRGSWWPGPDFEAILQLNGVSISQIRPSMMKKALREGEKFLNANPLAPDIDKERKLFRGYYQIIVDNLGLPLRDNRLVEELHLRMWTDLMSSCSPILYPRWSSSKTRA
jgi:hypothetical protein